MVKKTAVLIGNLGTPDSPKPSDVYRYLTEFLNDSRAFDIHPIARMLLVNGIIIPFRYRNSARAYKKLWTTDGSPLLIHGENVQRLLQERFSNPTAEEGEVKVFLAMRYQNPSFETVLKNIYQYRPDKLIVIPLFPQYASATIGSVAEKLMKMLSKKQVIPEINMVVKFYDHPLYIRGLVEQGQQFNLREYDHILFSYHGLPERQLAKAHGGTTCRDHACESEINEENKFCYKAHCYATTRAVAEALGIEKQHYTVVFQSRLGRGWITPFSDHRIIELAKKGAKKILVFSPAFVSDCLETTIEIGDEYQELFEEHGGEKIQLVPGLNENKTWITALEDIVRSRL